MAVACWWNGGAIPTNTRTSPHRTASLLRERRFLGRSMSALFNFQSLLLVILLAICTATYVRATFPGVVDRNKEGVFGIFFKLARIGERLSPYVSLACLIMAVYNLV